MKCHCHPWSPDSHTFFSTGTVFFVQVDQGTLFELILAANYLDIKGLLDVTCKTVANMIKGEEDMSEYANFATVLNSLLNGSVQERLLRRSGRPSTSRMTSPQGNLILALCSMSH